MKEVPLTRGKSALVDDEDFERSSQFEWYAQLVGGLWYAARTQHVPRPAKPVGITLQRFLLNVPKGTRIKFIDGNGLNCQKANFRLDVRNLTGEKFGRLTVGARAPRKEGRLQWLCLCSCGGKTIIDQSNWGKVISCGCYHSEMMVDRNQTHGLTGTRTYHIWASMRDRCRNPNNQDYKDYGGRGIFVCERWDSFENFFADMGEAPDNLTLDRRNNDGPYSPDNCRWATRKEQNRNTRRNSFYTANGKTQCLSAWTEETGVPYETLRKRIRDELPPELVLFKGHINLPLKQLNLFPGRKKLSRMPSKERVS